MGFLSCMGLVFCLVELDYNSTYYATENTATSQQGTCRIVVVLIQYSPVHCTSLNKKLVSIKQRLITKVINTSPPKND